MKGTLTDSVLSVSHTNKPSYVNIELMCPLTRLGEPVLGAKWAFLLLLSHSCWSVTSSDTEPVFCELGNTLVLREIYPHVIGWECFEKSEHASNFTIYECTTPQGFRVPCIKNGSNFLDFASTESKYEIFSFLPLQHQEEIHWCFFDVPECRLPKTPRVLDDGAMSRIWMPGTNITICSTEARNKFHIAMLSISFILGIPATIISSYLAWYEERELLRIIRNLVTAITFRSLLTLLIQTEVILPTVQASKELNAYGIPALSTFETLTLNLVLGFWLVFTIFVGQTVRERYKPEEPNVNLYTYGTIGLSVFFAIIWLIVMASTQPLEGWLGVRYWSQWLNEPLRICFLAFQVYALCSTILIQRQEKDPELLISARRIRIVVIYICVLSPIFILQFCLNAGTPISGACEEAYYYTLYAIDGAQGALVCLFFFYVDTEVVMLVKDFFGLNVKSTLPATSTKISTLDSLREKRFSSESPDVMYTTVITPDRYEKVLGLYQKQNVAHKPSFIEVDGDIFQTCTSEAVRKMSVVSQYYDAQSYDGSDFHEVLEAEPAAIQEVDEKEEPVTLRKDPENSVPVTYVRSSITPIQNSKYSSIDRYSGSSRTDSVGSSTETERGSVVVNLSGLDGTESYDFPEEPPPIPLRRSKGKNNLKKISSDSGSNTEDEATNKVIELREHLKTEPPQERQSTLAVRGSSSEASLNGEVPHLELQNDFQTNIPKILVSRIGSSSSNSDVEEPKQMVFAPSEEPSSSETTSSDEEELKMMTKIEAENDELSSSDSEPEEEKVLPRKCLVAESTDASNSFSEDDNYQTVIKKTDHSVPRISDETFTPENIATEIEYEPSLVEITDLPANFLVRAKPVKIDSSASDSSSSSSDSEHDNQEATFGISCDHDSRLITKIEPPTAPKEDKPSFLYQKPPDTLPDIYKDLITPPARPRSLAKDKNSISNMFSSHKNKLLASRSTEDLLESSKPKNHFSQNVQALVSPTRTQSLEDGFQESKQPKNFFAQSNQPSSLPELTNRPKVTRQSSISSTSSEESSTSYSTIEQYPTLSPRLVLQDKGGKDWDPQDISFTDSSNT